MYMRRKRNRSGSITIVVVDKSEGKYREIKTFGTSTDPDEIDRFALEAGRWLSGFGGQQELDFSESARALEGVKGALALVERTMLDAPQAILNRVTTESDSTPSGTTSSATLPLPVSASR